MKAAVQNTNKELAPKMAPRPKREVHRELPFLERPLGDIAFQLIEWVQAEHPLKSEKPPKVPDPDRRQIHRERPFKERSIVDITKATWEWLRAEHPVKPKKVKKKKKSRKPTFPKSRQKAKTRQEQPRRTTLPRIPEQEESGSEVSSLRSELHAEGLHDQVHVGAGTASQHVEEESDVDSEISVIDEEEEPPVYKRNHTRPPSYMTVDRE